MCKDYEPRLREAYDRKNYVELVNLFCALSKECLTELWDTLPKISYKQAIADKQQCGEINLHILNASKFLNAALTIYRREILKLTGQAYIKRTLTPYGQLDAKEQKIISHIREVESVFLTAILANQTESTWDSNLRYKRALELIRDKVQERLDAIKARYGETCVPFNPEQSQDVRETYEAIARELKEFLGSLIHECEQILGRPPCAYSVIGLGSLAKEEMTPYSDIEFAILIAEDLPEIKSYCYSISMLLNLKIIALGETSIPNSLFGINFDDITRSGLQLDLGGKTPLGREDQNYELIQTPVAMAGYTTEETFNRCKLLPIEMVTFTHIYGDVSLTETYRQKVMEELDREVPVTEKIPTIPVELVDIDELLAEQNLRRGRFQDKTYSFMEHSVIGDGNCGFISLGVDRDQVIEMLMKKVHDLEIRRIVAPEIIAALKENNLPENLLTSELKQLYVRYTQIIEFFGHKAGSIKESILQKHSELKPDIYELNPEQLLQWLNQPEYRDEYRDLNKFRLDEVFPQERQLELWSEQEDTYSLFVASYLSKQGKKWLTFIPNKGKPIGILDAIIKLKNIPGICIWATDAMGIMRGEPVHYCGDIERATHVLHRDNGTHFSLLEITQLQETPEEANVLGTADSPPTRVSQVLSVRKQRALRLLKNDIERFGPRLGLYVNEGKLYEVKHDIYRLPNTIIDDLALYYAVPGNSSWQRIDALCQAKYLHPAAAERLKNVFSMATELRLKTYQHYRAQQETFSALFKLVPVEPNSMAVVSSSAQQEHYKLTTGQITILTEAYKTLLPLCKMAKLFVHFQGRMMNFKYAFLYDKRAKTAGQIAARLCDYQVAADYFREALQIEPESAELWNDLGAVLSRVRECQGAIESFQVALATSEKQHGGNHPSVAILLTNLGNAYGLLGNYKEQKNLLERALQINVSFCGADHVAVASILSNLGVVYGLLGDAQKQKELLERALQIFETSTSYGPNHVEVARNLTNLGNAYGSLGNHKEQKDLLERALRINESFYGTDHIEVARTLVNLGVAYGSLGKYRKQKELLERALQINVSFYGADHVEMMKTLANLGIAYGALGDAQKKKDLLERALRIGESFYGTNHVEVARILANLGTASGTLGDAQKLEDLLGRTLQILENFYGADYVDVARTLANLGAAYGSLGKYKKQKDLLERSLKILEDFYGANYVEVAKTLENLANAYSSLGKYRKQKELLERALQINVSFYGTNHVEVARTLTNLGNAYGSLGKYKEQKELLERALQINVSFYGTNHVEVARTLTNLGNVYGSLGKYKEQKDLLERALQINVSFYGTGHVEVAKTLGSLANTYGSLGDTQKLRFLSERTLQILENFYGADHVEVARTLANLGVACGLLGNYQEQKELLERSLRILEDFYGANHVEVARTLANLGVACGLLGNYQEQKELLERSLRILEDFYGADYVEVATILSNLGDAYISSGDMQKPKYLFKRALKINESFYGTDHVVVARTLGNLGTLYGVLGKYKKSKDLLERVLRIFETSYGPNHVDVAIILTSLGTAYGGFGDMQSMQKQKELLKRALRIFETSYGPNHVAVARILGNLGTLYGLLRKYKKSKDLLERGLRIFETSYGPNHVAGAITRFNLGMAYRGLGNSEQARKEFEFAYRLFLASYGPNHVNTHMANRELASLSTFPVGSINLQQTIGLLYNQGVQALAAEQYKEAIPILNQLLEILSVTSTQSSMVLKIQQYLVRAYMETGDLEQVITVCKNYLDTAERQEDINIKELASTLYSLACIYTVRFYKHHSPQDLEEAERHFQHAIAICPDANKYTEYAHFLYRQQRYQEAVDNLKTFLTLPGHSSGESCLSYGNLEKPTLDADLQQEIEQNGKIIIEANLLAYYLIIKCYYALGEREVAQQYLAEFTAKIASIQNPFVHRLLDYVVTQNKVELQEQDDEVAVAIVLSLQQDETEKSPTEMLSGQNEDEELAAAVALSLQEGEENKESAIIAQRFFRSAPSTERIDSDEESEHVSQLSSGSFLAGDEHKKPPTSRPDSRCHDSSQETCHSPTPSTSSSSFFSGRAGVPPAQEFSVSSAATQYDIHPGLQYQPMFGDGNCLYRAVSYHLGHGEDVSFLRGIVAANLEHNKTQYADFIPLRDGQSIQDYIAEVGNTSAWATEVEINILMRLLDRPIVVIGSDGMIRNKEAVNQYSGKEPIFVFYNGGDEQGSGKPGHYDVLLLRDGYDGRSILSEMRNRSTSQTSSLP